MNVPHLSIRHFRTPSPVNSAWSTVTAVLAALAVVPVLSGQELPQGRASELGLSPTALERIAPALDAYVTSGKLPGMVAVIARHGKVGYQQAVGWMDVARRVPMRTDGVFRIFSMTKPIIAAAALRLVDQGRLHLSDPVAKYIPAFADTKVYAGGPAAQPAVQSPGTPITVEHLLTHTSGLTYGFFGQTPVDSIYLRANLMRPTQTIEQFADSLARLPLLFSPGSRWTYSVSIDVLGRVVEVASGRPLDQFLDDEIFGPLGMRETGFHVRPAMEGRIPVLYTRGTDGRLNPEEPLLEESYLPTGRFLLWRRRSAFDSGRLPQICSNAAQRRRAPRSPDSHP